MTKNNVEQMLRSLELVRANIDEPAMHGAIKTELELAMSILETELVKEVA